MKKNFKKVIDEKLEVNSDFNTIKGKIETDELVATKTTKMPFYKKPLFLSLASLSLVLVVTTSILVPYLLKNGKEDEPIEFQKIETKYALNKVEKPHDKAVVELDEKYIKSLKDFSIKYNMAVNSDEENQIFSPISIATCYTMLLQGCKDDSYDQLKNALCIPDELDIATQVRKMLENNAKSQEKIKLDIAQSIWIDNSFKEKVKKDYLDTLSNNFYAEGYSGNLESNEMHKLLAEYINKKTNNFLDVKEEDFKNYGGVMWLLNTIYLKTNWTNKFYETKDADFHNIDNTITKTSFFKSLQNVNVYSNSNIEVVSISLDGNFKANFMVPKEETNLNDLLLDESIVKDFIYFNSDSMPKKNYYASIKLPKFKQICSYDLKKLFQNRFSVIDIFDEYLANIKGIADLSNQGKNLYVEKTKHEAGIEFNDKGVEAAAYTIIEMEDTAAEIPPKKEKEYTFDSPFLYSITDSNNIPLFVGSYKKVEKK